jgi:4-hydroxy-3-polyprenylbenzoate decarboxylase
VTSPSHSNREKTADGRASRGYPDLREHLANLDRHGLLLRIDAPVNKDTELHPLVRWQFRGGLAERDRRAFMFTNVTDSNGRRYETPVVVGALAASTDIYRLGLEAESVDDIAVIWARALSHPLPPRIVDDAPCQEVTITGEELRNGGGLDALPVPISTPGFDAAPYLTATNVITRDPKTGVQNLGTYRGALKAPDRIGMMMSPVSGGRAHWMKYKERGEPMPAAFVIGAPPAVSYAGPQKLAIGVDELATAGGLAGAPIEVVRCKTVDLLVPADAEIVIEGLVRTHELEPEGPFGESHGHIALEEYNFIFDVTAITHRRNPLFLSVISQVTPSESSVIKRVAYEPIFLSHLRDQLGIPGIRRVSMHEPLTNLRPVIILQFAPATPRAEVWRALHGASNFQPYCGKIVFAVDDDIDPENGDALLWALAYRSNPALDTAIVPNRERAHGPHTDRRSDTDSALLVDATRKGPTPPLALPTRSYMEQALVLWDKLGLPALKPQTPWHGYSMGLWSDAWEEAAQRAIRGTWQENGVVSAGGRRSDVGPGSPVPLPNATKA